jgi:regulator of replication initiation timing
MAEVTLELLGEQMTRLFEEQRALRVEMQELGNRLDRLEARTVTKGDIVALFRGLEFKIEAWHETQEGQGDRLARLERRVKALEEKLEVK